MTATARAHALAQTAAEAAAEKLGTDIVAYDVSDHIVITDAFLIVTADNERQVRAIVDAIEEQLLKQHSAKPLRREGKGEGHWVLLDYSDIVVHVFAAEDRQFYALDKLWSDCPRLELVLDEESRPAEAGQA